MLDEKENHVKKKRKTKPEEVLKTINTLKVLDSVEMPSSSLCSCQDIVRWQRRRQHHLLILVPHLHSQCLKRKGENCHLNVLQIKFYSGWIERLIWMQPNSWSPFCDKKFCLISDAVCTVGQETDGYKCFEGVNHHGESHVTDVMQSVSYELLSGSINNHHIR